MNKYKFRRKALIILEDGTIFYGKSAGFEGLSFGELCFNTGMTGYQEIFTDPSYNGQLMVMTNAHIGNYGAVKNEIESDSVKIAGLICKNFSFFHSRYGSAESLQDFLNKNKIVCISDVDTRALVSYIRDNGFMNAVISTESNPDIKKLKLQLKKIPSMAGLELASNVSTKEPYFYGNKLSKYKVAVLDLGVKMNILRNLSKRNCYLKVFPHSSSFNDMNEWAPDAYFISNGPGDPEPLENAINVTKKILDTGKPLFGICLGHQVIALANNIKTYKMKNGHRGINHPVINLSTGKGEITSQNHGFAINKKDTEKNKNIEVTHMHLNDNTIAGIRLKDKNCFSVQYHPEASAGPHDSSYLFDDFISMIT
ncbi:MAG: carbamoyl-phosphate synthase small subunit [Cryomorphaceae bacterium]|nr:MAG: carbamoyl-phosphate synthase small subunit [Cryomorphaceae bacterium]